LEHPGAGFLEAGIFISFICVTRLSIRQLISNSPDYFSTSLHLIDPKAEPKADPLRCHTGFDASFDGERRVPSITGYQEKARGVVEGKKKPTNEGGLNPYQRRHGGDRSKCSKTFGAMQHRN
jgi:hypothetical protein